MGEFDPVDAEPSTPHRSSADVCADKCPDRSGTKAFIISQRELCWLAFISALAGFLIGRWIP